MNIPQTVQVVQQHEWLTITAIIAGPILALLAQRMLDWWRQRDKTRKSLYFKLMATRAMFNSPQHVEALNSIDVVFSNDKSVRDLWKKALDHLATDEMAPGWNDTLDTLRVDLYQEIGNKLGYKYTTDYIKRGIYFPTYHSNFVMNQNAIYGGLAKAIKDGELRVKLIDGEPPPDVKAIPPR